LEYGGVGKQAYQKAQFAHLPQSSQKERGNDVTGKPISLSETYVSNTYRYLDSNLFFRNPYNEGKEHVFNLKTAQ